MSVNDLDSRVRALSPQRQALLARMRREPAAGRDIPVLPDDSPAPLSFAQQRLWFLDQLLPGSAAYNIAAAYRLTGPVNPEMLRQAIEIVVQRHTVLRTVFDLRDGLPWQRVRPPAKWALPVEDLSADPTAVGQFATDEAARPFNLADGPVMRSRLLHLGHNAYVLLLTVHHIAGDAWSLGILAQEIAQAYSGRAMPPLPIQYRDFAAWQRDWLSGERLERQLSYWVRALAGIQPTDLPGGRPRLPVRRSAGAKIRWQFSAPLADRLEALGARTGASIFMILTAGLQALLFRYTGQAELAVGTPVAGRTRQELEPLIGFFVNMLTLRARVRPAESFLTLLEQVRARAIEAYSHQDVPFEKLVETLKPERELSRNPLFDIVIAYQNTPERPVGLPGIAIGPIETEFAVARFDLELHMMRVGSGFEAVLQYATDLFEAQAMERLLGHYAALLESIATAPETPVGALRFITSVERRTVVQRWNETALPNTPGFVHQAAAAAARRTPDRIAVDDGKTSLAWGALDRGANGVAHRLRALGAAEETVVAVCLEQSAQSVIALLAVLKAGATYLPLDPRHPPARLRAMMAQAEARVLVAHETLAHKIEAPGGCRHLAADQLTVDDQAEPPATALSAENLAYVIFTSGSSGQPKGIGVSHASLANLCQWHRDAFALTEDSCATLLAGVAFDAAAWELWPALSIGARLTVVTPDTAMDPEALAKRLVSTGTTHCFVPTPLACPLLRIDWPPQSDLRWLLVGGDRLGALPPGERSFAVVNNYGPTETTVVATSGRVDAALPAPSIGRPIRNAQAYILDTLLEPCGIGIPGELYIGGAGVARGYVGAPAMTAERFLPDPFGPPGARLYRTGDTACFLADGQIAFLGRLDRQIKIRGHRIEPAEIEAVLLSHPSVSQAAVTVSDTELLLAYVVWSDGETPDTGTLHRYAAQQLPAYMVPNTISALSALPLTANGKLDLAALPIPAETPVGDDAPQGEIERIVWGVWQELLGIGVFGIDDDFFSLGGHSLLGVSVIGRLSVLVGYTVPLGLLFSHPTVRGLAGALERFGGGSDDEGAFWTVGDGPVVLSPGQARWWFLSRLGVEAGSAHIAASLCLDGALSVGRLEAALGAIVARHEPLRTAMVAGDGGPEAVALAAPERLAIAVEDVSEATVGERARAEAARPFALDRDLLLRARLLRLGPERHWLVVTLHHAASDGWSLGVLVRELAVLYGGGALPPLACRYSDVARAQRARDYARELAYWRGRLAGLPLLELPPPDGAGAGRAEIGGSGSAVRVLGAEASAAIEAGTRRHGLTLFMALLAAAQLVLARMSGQTDFAVGTPVAHRLRPDWEDLVGFFVNTLVLRSDLDGAISVGELAARVRTGVLDGLAHQAVPFDRLVEALEVPRDGTRNPLFSVLVAVQNTPLAELALAGLTVTALPSPLVATRLDLEIHAFPAPDGLQLVATYRTERWEGDAVVRLLARLETVLSGFVAALEREPELPWRALPGLAAAELTVLGEWGAGPVRQDENGRRASVLSRILAVAAAQPASAALEDGTAIVSYGELVGRARRWARRLRHSGVGTDMPVGLALGRTAEHAAAMLGIWLAGGAYVPLDPALPPARLAAMVETAGLRLAVTTPEAAERLPASVTCLGPEDAATVAHALAIGDMTGGAAMAQQAAYILFTSGSTGRPKGVVLPFAALDNLVAWHEARHPGPARVLQFAAASFDVSVEEYLTGWAGGGTVVLVDEATRRDPVALLDHIRRHRIERLFLPVVMLEALAQAVQAAGRPERSVRTVITAGEPLRVTPAVRAWARQSGWRLDNQYGPTEAHVVSAGLLDGSPSAWPEYPPIGRPIDAVRLAVTDPLGQLAPLGAAGELTIAGAALARGYAGDPALTALCFVPDPAGPPGSRRYRTGDRVRWGADGALRFLGRADRQVKLRGYRIELGEIETALSRLDGVVQAAVMVQHDELVAYIAPAGLDPGALAGGLGRSLPGYMVPGRWVLLDRLPVNRHGKLDRRVLPDPAGLAVATAEAAWTAPEGAAECLLAALWQDLLGVERVGRDDDFFALGGHSLRATQLVSRLAQRHGAVLPVAALFEQPVLRDLALRLEAVQLETALTALDSDELDALLAGLDQSGGREP